MAIILGDYFFANANLKIWAKDLKRWSVIVIAPAIGLGVIQLVRWESSKIRKREKEWPISVFTIIMTFVTFLVGLMPPITASEGIIWLVMYVTVPMMGVGWSLSALCYVGAFFRSLRVKNVESFFLLFSVLVVFVSSVPAIATLHPALAPFGSWYVKYPNVGGSWSNAIAGGVAILGLALRLVLGRERGFFR